MTLFARLREKPWHTDKQAHLRPEYSSASGLVAMPSQRVGLYVFLVVVASLFALFSVGYQLRADYQDWRPINEPWQLWLNTGSLLGASICLQLAASRVTRGMPGFSTPLVAAGVLTVCFLMGQLWAWMVLIEQGHFVASNPASSSFYLITGVHALHMLGGFVAWYRVYQRMEKGQQAGELALSIRLCATYWHFLFIVWLFLFYMLLVS